MADGFKTAGSSFTNNGPMKFQQVRSIFGHGRDRQEAIAKYEYIPDGGMNAIIKEWHDKQPERDIEGATPSGLTKCPRVIWLEKHNVKRISEMTWAVKQRLLLGRIFENQFAIQLDDAGKLLYHWKDDPGVEVDRFESGDGLSHFTGVPDYLLNLSTEEQLIFAISDAKTARSDSFGYVPINDIEVWTNWGYYKYRIQLTAYYKLAHANEWWFKDKDLPLPTHLHLPVYALDDGVIRRELLWQPSEADLQKVDQYVERYNKALLAEECPPCTCGESFDDFDVKFCPYGTKSDPKSKVNDSCCSDNLIPTKG